MNVSFARSVGLSIVGDEVLETGRDNRLFEFAKDFYSPTFRRNMRRRTFTIGAGLALSTGVVGCASQSSTESPSGTIHSANDNGNSTESPSESLRSHNSWDSNERLSTAFETTDARPSIDIDDAPEVDVTDGLITAVGTVRYVGPGGGKVALVHAGYEFSQSRLDLIVAAVNDKNHAPGDQSFVDEGYCVTARCDEPQPSVMVTEHHVGGAFSTTANFDPILGESHD